MGNALQTSIDALYGARHVGLKAGIPKEVPALTVKPPVRLGHPVGRQRRAVDPARRGEDRARGRHGEHEPGAVRPVRARARGIPFGVQPQLQDTLFGALLDPIPGLMMAQTAEKIAKRLGITREEQDQYALRSHKLGTAAVKEGRFAAEIEPVVVKTRKGEETIATDDHIKPETSLEALSKLRAAFGKDGTVTAGNASGVVDGAAAVVLTTAERAKADKLDVWARIVAWSYRRRRSERDGDRTRARDPALSRPGGRRAARRRSDRDQRGLRGAVPRLREGSSSSTGREST